VTIVQKNVCTDREKTERNSWSVYVYEEIDTDVITFHYLRMLKEREKERERERLIRKIVDII